jgi:hypothetical protein
LGRIAKEFIDPLAWKDAQPSPSHFVVGPLGNDIGAIAQDDVQVIGENGIGEDIDPKNRSQSFQTGPDPLSAGGVISTCERIIPSQKSTANTALDAVDNADFVGIE